jgi:hypothetical protein
MHLLIDSFDQQHSDAHSISFDAVSDDAVKAKPQYKFFALLSFSLLLLTALFRQSRIEPASGTYRLRPYPAHFQPLLRAPPLH